jgi:hypothetical protein
MSLILNIVRFIIQSLSSWQERRLHLLIQAYNSISGCLSANWFTIFFVQASQARDLGLTLLAPGLAFGWDFPRSQTKLSPAHGFLPKPSQNSTVRR